MDTAYFDIICHKKHMTEYSNNNRITLKEVSALDNKKKENEELSKQNRNKYTKP